MSRNISRSGRYGSLSIFLHWAMLALMAAVYASMELRDIFPKGSSGRDDMKTWHFMLGLLVFVLVWLRLIARAMRRAPSITPPPPRWQERASGLVHLLLYGLMICLPLLGWASLSAAGKPVPFFGLELPAWVGQDRALSRQLKEVHETLASAGYFLIGLHAAAALFHHYVMRDDTLRRMLPARP